MTYALPKKRRATLIEMLGKKTGFGITTFMDTIDSQEELAAMNPVIRKHAENDDLWVIDYYEKNLAKWPKPELDDAFRATYPLVSARLDTNWKIRVFLRAADARDVSPDLMAQVFEDIIHRHEIKGEQLLHYPRYRDDEFGRALRIVYHTQVPYHNLTKLMLPDFTGAGVVYCRGDAAGLYVDWRNQAQRELAKAAGAPY